MTGTYHFTAANGTQYSFAFRHRFEKLVVDLDIKNNECILSCRRPIRDGKVEWYDGKQAYHQIPIEVRELPTAKAVGFLLRRLNLT